MIGIVWEGLSFNRTGKKYDHWLDKAKEKYDPLDVEDVKVVLRVLQVFL